MSWNNSAWNGLFRHIAAFGTIRPGRVRVKFECCPGEDGQQYRRLALEQLSHHVGISATPYWLETDWLLGQFSGTRESAIKAYIDFVRVGVGLGSLWSETRNQVFLGSERFVKKTLRNLPEGDLLEVPRLQRRAPAKRLADYAKANERNTAMAKAYRSGDYTMKQIADYFGVHYATVSRRVRKSEQNV